MLPRPENDGSTESITNAMKTDEIHIQRNEIGWILCQTAASVMTLLSLYLTSAAIYHRIRQLSRITRRNFAIPENYTRDDARVRTRTRLSTTSSDRSRLSTARTSEILIIIAAVTITLRLLSEQQILNLSDRSEETCRVIAVIHIILYALPVAPIYTFLWVRQRKFYFRDPIRSMVDSNGSRACVVRTISMAIIILMVIGELLTVLIFTVTISYKPGKLGCYIDKTLLPRWGPWLMILFFTATFQILLLGLYIWPLIKMRSSSFAISGNFGPSESRVYGSRINVRKIIKRACAVTFACILSDVIAVLVTLGTQTSAVSNLVYDFNLIINLIAITCTFPNWRNRLFPFCRKRDADDPTLRPSSPRYVEYGQTHTCNFRTLPQANGA